MTIENTFTHNFQYAEARVAAFVAAIFSAFMSWVNLSEFYYLKHSNTIAYYTSVEEGSPTWFSSSITLYKTYVLVVGILFVIGFVFSLINLRKMDRLFAFFTLTGVFILMLFQILMEFIETQ